MNHGSHPPLSEPSTSGNSSDPELTVVAISGSGSSPADLDFICSVEVPAPDYHYESNRVLSIARNGPELTGNGVVDTYDISEDTPTREGQSRIMVVPSETFAIGYFIQLLEIHNMDETHSHDQLKDSNLDYTGYLDWVTGLSLRDRRHRLLDQMDAEITGKQAQTKPILEQGSFRGTPADEGLAEDYLAGVDTNPKHCFKNALKIKRRHLKDDTVQYVEGVALSKHAARMAIHAWVEVDDTIVEPTWPWHTPTPPKEAVYYGTPIGGNRVADADLDIGAPLLLDITNPSQLG